MPRYSIFFAPLQGNPLNDVAAKWLGRDAFSGKAVARPSPVDGMDLATFDSLTNSARRYGFHGTLKAPFELAQGRSIDELDEAIAEYCKSLQPFVLPHFKIGQLGRFFALLPSEPSEALKTLATALVCDFDDFRAPLSEADIARRNPDKLSPSQRDNLLNWGYPHIFDNFRFHMTLSDPVPDEWTEPFRVGLEAHFGDSLNEPQIVSSLTVFEEPERGAPFTIHRQFPIS